MIPQVARDTYVLLGLGIIVLGFCAFELAGLTVPGFHTVSYIAKTHRWLYYVIWVAFGIAGPVSVIWWWAHINLGNISR